MTESTHTQDRLPRQRASFHARSYDFVLEALNQVIDAQSKPMHVSALELAEGVRKLALERYGTMARTVLEHWGICSTEDMGQLVFEMMEQGVLVKEDDEELEDFSNLFSFEDAFDADYPWMVAL